MTKKEKLIPLEASIMCLKTMINDLEEEFENVRRHEELEVSSLYVHVDDVTKATRWLVKHFKKLSEHEFSPFLLTNIEPDDKVTILSKITSCIDVLDISNKSRREVLGSADVTDEHVSQWLKEALKAVERN